MPLNYNGTEQIGALNVWSFTDEQGSPFKTDDPMLALKLGAPVGDEPPPAPTPDALAPPPPSPSASGQTITPDPAMFGLGDAGQPRPMLAQVTDTERAALERAAGMSNAHAAPASAADAGGSVLDRYDNPPAAPAPRDVIRPDENPGLDFGDGPGTSPAQVAPQQAAAGQPDALHPLTQAVASERPQRFRYVGGSPGGWTDATRAYAGPDPEAAQRLIDKQGALTDMRMSTALTREELQQAELKKQQQDLMMQTVRDQVAIADQQAVVAEREEYKRVRREKIQADAQAVSERKVEPNRIFTEDPGAGFVAALALGLGAFGAALTGGQNTAYDIIQTSMRNDINEQQRQIDEARLANEKADNALQRELDEGADPSFARQKLELLQNRYAQAVVQSQEVQQQMRSLGVDTADVLAQLQQDGIALEASLMDKIGVKASQKYSAPRSGGMVEDPRFFEKQGQYLSNLEKAGGLMGDFEPEAVRVARTKAEIDAAAKQGASPENVQKLGAELNTGTVSVGDLWTQKEQTEQTLRSLSTREGNLPGRGLIEDALPDILAGPGGRTARRALSQSAEFLLRRLTGAAATDPETARQLQAVAAVYENSSSSDEEVQRAWRQHSELVDRMLSVRAAAYGSAALNQWKDNARSIMRDFNTQTDRGILPEGE